MHGTLDRFQWNDARVGRLKEMIDEKLTATKAAEDLGITRNAVIGKAHRLGWNFQSESKNNGKFAEVNRARRQPRQKPTALPPMEPEPDALRLTVLQLKNKSCRYIVTDDHPMLYCGLQKEHGNYCAHHAKKMYLPPDFRNRAPRPR